MSQSAFEIGRGLSSADAGHGFRSGVSYSSFGATWQVAGRWRSKNGFGFFFWDLMGLTVVNSG